MGNLKSNKTKEEWDDLVDKSQSHSDQVIDIMNTEQFIQEAAENYVKSLNLKVNVDEYKEYAINDFIAGAEWMMENIKINFRRVK